MATSRTDLQLLTVEDILAMPDDGDRLELIDGELLRMAPTGFEHGDIMFNLGGALRRFVVAANLGRVTGGDAGFVLRRDPDTLLAPDVAFVRADRLPVDRQGFLELVPDLVVEVISPSDRFNDVTRKVAIYLDAGVQCVWLIQPLRKRVFVHDRGMAPLELANDDFLEGQDIIPGFQMRVADIFL
jgi:Uma2 family endonuclease